VTEGGGRNNFDDDPSLDRVEKPPVDDKFLSIEHPILYYCWQYGLLEPIEELVASDKIVAGFYPVVTSISKDHHQQHTILQQ
jgi:hypothetical protein